MKPLLGHLQINVATANLGFYKDLLSFLGWQTLYEDQTMIGAASAQDSSLWFVGGAKEVAYDYDGPGMNHIGFGAERQEDVIATARYLEERGIARLFETPRHRPEFAGGEGQTYFQVMFESPDRLLFEVVYTGPKQD